MTYAWLATKTRMDNTNNDKRCEMTKRQECQQGMTK
jgi:hypothetical protein